MAATTLTLDAGVATITLNRPERKNAITGELGVDLAAALEAAQANVEVNVVLLQGAGGAFCSELDLTAFNADPAPSWRPHFQRIWRRAHCALYNCQKPIVAAVERYAINGGAALALAADLMVVGEEAFVQVGEVQQGMAAPYNMAWLALRFPEVLTAQLTLTGRRFSGAQLHRLGVAYESVADADVLGTAQALATQLAGYPAGAAVAIKGGMRAHRPLAANAWFDQFMPEGPNKAPQRQRG